MNATACCDLHNQHCEPPGDLCCGDCTEGTHPLHNDGTVCVLTDHKLLAAIQEETTDDAA